MPEPDSPTAAPPAAAADPVRLALADPALLHRLRIAAVSQSRGRLDADDIVQKVCERVLRKAAGYAADKGSASGWVCGFVPNVVREELRRAGRLPKNHPDLAEVAPAREQADPDDQAAETRRRVELYLDRLSPESRDIIETKHLRSESHDQMVPRYGPTNAAVRKRLSRAMAELKAVANRHAEEVRK